MLPLLELKLHYKRMKQQHSNSLISYLPIIAVTAVTYTYHGAWLLLTIMRKLSGTARGTDEQKLKTSYHGTVRPNLEYSSSA